MAALRPVGGSGKTYDLLKTLVSISRERCARVACATKKPGILVKSRFSESRVQSSNILQTSASLLQAEA
jgi:hypothetical protein